MLNWTELDLPAGAALEWDDADGSGSWRIERVEGELWLSSPALPRANLTQEQRLVVWAGMLGLHWRGDSTGDLRFMADADGQVHLQALMLRSMDASTPSQAQAQAMEAAFLACRSAWGAWAGAMLGQALPAAAAPGVNALAGRTATYRSLLQSVQLDELLATGCHPIEDEGCIVIEPPDEAWSAALLPCTSGQGADLLMPLVSMPAEPEAAAQLLQQALALNAGPVLSPEVTITIDGDWPGGTMLMLHSRLQAASLRANDIKAAIGRQLGVAEELQDRLGPAAGGSVAGAWSSSGLERPHMGMVLRG